MYLQKKMAGDGIAGARGMCICNSKDAENGKSFTLSPGVFPADLDLTVALGGWHIIILV